MNKDLTSKFRFEKKKLILKISYKTVLYKSIKMCAEY